MTLPDLPRFEDLLARIHFIVDANPGAFLPDLFAPVMAAETAD